MCCAASAVVAGVLAFGSGVLISTLAFDLVDEAETTGGLGATAIGLLAGATTYVAANAWLGRRGAARRKNPGDMQMSEEEMSGGGSAIAVGALLDGVPESVVLGMTLLGGGGVGVPVLAAIFISNLPEGLSSAPETVAVITAVAAGAILAMVADTMIPEAFEKDGLYTGLITAFGFIAAFAISRSGG